MQKYHFYNIIGFFNRKKTYFWTILNQQIMSRNSIFYKSALAIAAIAVVFAFSSCNKDGKNVKRFQDAAMNLDNTTQTLEYEYDYWPNGGIRASH